MLDDLAQEVLIQGGEMVAASREEIPKGKPILAILERPDSKLTKLYTVDLNNNQKIERSAK